jgi:hypothetical protein
VRRRTEDVKCQTPSSECQISGVHEIRRNPCRLQTQLHFSDLQHGRGGHGLQSSGRSKTSIAIERLGTDGACGTPQSQALEIALTPPTHDIPKQSPRDAAERTVDPHSTNRADLALLAVEKAKRRPDKGVLPILSLLVRKEHDALARLRH